MQAPAPVSVIVPASNEEGWIGACLDALMASCAPSASPALLEAVEVVVVANGCRDGTAGVVRARSGAASARGWRLEVIEVERGDKLHALNLGDAAAHGPILVYLDADVVVSPPLLGQLAQALDRPGAAWASGRPVVAPAHSRFTRAYARFWQRLPFMQQGVPGFGIFAVNAAGRARWGAFPDIISDDTFARLHFAPHERLMVPATYDWPMAEGAGRLVRVRRRQDAGVKEVLARWPALAANQDTAPHRAAALARLAARDPGGFAVYAGVALAARLGRRLRPPGDWTRGR